LILQSCLARPHVVAVSVSAQRAEVGAATVVGAVEFGAVLSIKVSAPSTVSSVFFILCSSDVYCCPSRVAVWSVALGASFLSCSVSIILISARSPSPALRVTVAAASASARSLLPALLPEAIVNAVLQPLPPCEIQPAMAPRRPWLSSTCTRLSEPSTGWFVAGPCSTSRAISLLHTASSFFAWPMAIAMSAHVPSLDLSVSSSELRSRFKTSMRTTSVVTSMRMHAKNKVQRSNGLGPLCNMWGMGLELV